MLTSRELDTLNFIREYLREQGCGPLLSEIAEALQINAKAHVHRLLKGLEQKGYITRTRQHRSIRLQEKAVDHIPQANLQQSEIQNKVLPENDNLLPMAGTIAAGVPLEAIELSDVIDINQMFSGAKRFVLRIRGDSMEEAGIFDNDWVVIQQTQSVRNGQIVVALVDQQEATLKRIQFIDGSTIRLIPENQRMQPIDYDKKRISIQGVLVGQFRQYE